LSDDHRIRFVAILYRALVLPTTMAFLLVILS